MIYKEIVGKRCNCHGCKKEMIKGEDIYVVNEAYTYGHIEKTRKCEKCTIKHIKQEIESLEWDLKKLVK